MKSIYFFTHLHLLKTLAIPLIRFPDAVRFSLFRLSYFCSHAFQYFPHTHSHPKAHQTHRHKHINTNTPTAGTLTSTFRCCKQKIKWKNNKRLGLFRPPSCAPATFATINFHHDKVMMKSCVCFRYMFCVFFGISIHCKTHWQPMGWTACKLAVLEASINHTHGYTDTLVSHGQTHHERFVKAGEFPSHQRYEPRWNADHGQDVLSKELTATKNANPHLHKLRHGSIGSGLVVAFRDDCAKRSMVEYCHK